MEGHASPICKKSLSVIGCALCFPVQEPCDCASPYIAFVICLCFPVRPQRLVGISEHKETRKYCASRYAKPIMKLCSAGTSKSAFVCASRYVLMAKICASRYVNVPFRCVSPYGERWKRAVHPGTPLSVCSCASPYGGRRIDSRITVQQFLFNQCFPVQTYLLAGERTFVSEPTEPLSDQRRSMCFPVRCITVANYTKQCSGEGNPPKSIPSSCLSQANDDECSGCQR